MYERDFKQFSGGEKMSENKTRALIISKGKQTIYFEDIKGNVWLVKTAEKTDINSSELF
jgi:hypothetical protein